MIAKLTPENSEKMTVSRIMSDKLYPTYSFLLQAQSEHIIYPLIGAATINLSINSTPIAIGGRTSVTEAPLPALSLALTRNTNVTLIATTPSIDFIVVSTSYDPFSSLRTSDDNIVDIATPITRDVGQGVYLRQVTDQFVCRETRLHIGETLSWNDGKQGGCWSSWPPHADKMESKLKYAEHEEYFLVITPSRGFMEQDGYFSNGFKVNDIVALENNQFLKVPLGSHSVCFHPQVGPSWGWYLWVYDSYLRKTYNTHAHHVTTYVK